MQDSCIRWAHSSLDTDSSLDMVSSLDTVSRHRCSSRHLNRHRSSHSSRRMQAQSLAGHAASADTPATRASSAASAVLRSRKSRQAGPVAVELSIRASSVLSVEQRSRQEHLSTSATSADGNRQTRRIHQNSVRNVETHLTITTLYNSLIYNYVF